MSFELQGGIYKTHCAVVVTESVEPVMAQIDPSTGTSTHCQTCENTRYYGDSMNLVIEHCRRLAGLTEFAHVTNKHCAMRAPDTMNR